MSLLLLMESLMAVGMSTFNIILMEIEGNFLVQESFALLMIMQALSAILCIGVYLISIFNSEIQLRAFAKVNEIEGLNMFCILLTSMILLSYDQLVVALLIVSGKVWHLI
ncbi:hypothetical protein FGO68_gene11902 [Halteria grandinella]|uniref:Uncharacterized protein n=1 Tax=Halteria grandinella TaxID=5974 RepID=A0A8J8NZ25_HALGN|nr:hypothetical protein FGO68_gene11902 [Halteria grandinella]